MADHFTLRLVDSRMLAPTVRHLVFERADGQLLAFVPGQFLQIHFAYADGTATKRSYSVATVGDGRSPVQQIEIAVSYVEGGAATALLGGLEHGGTVEASGPYGRFCLQDGDALPRYLDAIQTMLSAEGTLAHDASEPAVVQARRLTGAAFDPVALGPRSEVDEAQLERRLRKLRSATTTPALADRRYIELLALAARTDETRVAAVLGALLRDGEVPHAAAVEAQLAIEPPSGRDLAVFVPELHSYDQFVQEPFRQAQGPELVEGVVA